MPATQPQQPQAVNDRIDCNGWLGGSYQARSLAADAERTINLYLEYNSPGEGKSRATLYSTPGLNVFSTMPSTGFNQGIYSCSIDSAQHVFCVTGSTLFEIYADGTSVSRGTVSINQPVHWADDGLGNVALATGNAFYIYNLSSGVLTQISTVNGTPIIASDTTFIDGYFFVLITDTNYVYSSEPNQPLVWNDLSFTVKEGQSDHAVGLGTDHLQLWIMGSATIEVWYNAGNPIGFPFSRVQGGFVQHGLVAPSTVVQMEDGLFWLGGDSNGAVRVFRNSGYSAIRISTHALEAAINGYSNIADSTASSYLQEGHNFFRLDFPSANGGNGATWVYDTATQLWHERLYWNLLSSVWQCNPARYMCYAYGLYLGAHYSSNIIYTQSLDAATDAGNPIRRQRTGSPLADHMNWNQFHEFQLDMQMGIGVPLTGQGSSPLATLRFSDDGGYTWSNDIVTQLGMVGQTKARAMWRRLGKSRDRVYEVTITDPIQVAILNAYIRVSPGSGA